MSKAARALPWLLTGILATPATAQLHAADSLAVIQTVRRYHALLEANDTVALRGLIAGRAMVVFRGDAVALRGDALAASIRWDRAIMRDSSQVTARVLGSGAYVYTVSRFSARAAPIKGIEVESIFLSRIDATWLIELVHRSAGDPP